MAEAILTRAYSGEADVVVPITQGYHTALITVKSNGGISLDNVPIYCNDNGTWYNYTTNSNGQSLVSSNSGTLKVKVLPFFANNTMMIDQKNTCWNYVIDAPVGSSGKFTIKFDGYNIGESIEYNMVGNMLNRGSFGMATTSANNGTGFRYFAACPYFNNTFNYKFIDRISLIDLELGGGGGGGTSGSNYAGGAGGGGGSYFRINDIVVSNQELYTGYLGDGGNGGADSNEDYTNRYLQPGNAGGTTTFLGYSAIGGNGGRTNGGANNSYYGIGANDGYYGNGGNTDKNGVNSNLSIYGGGGGGRNANGGYPGGGTGGNSNDGTAHRASSGTNGLGGGGGGGYRGRVTNSSGDYVWYHSGGTGGAGLIRITIKAK